MVVKLDETLESLLKQIEVAKGPFSTEIYTCTEQINDWKGPYGGLKNVDQLLWDEFYKHFPSEFEKDIIPFGLMKAEADEIQSEGESTLISKLLQPGGFLTRTFQLMDVWREHMGTSINTLTDFAVEYGNNDDPTKLVKVSRYYGGKGVVYRIEHQGIGLSYRTLAEQFLQNPESLNDFLGPHRDEPIKNVFENRKIVVAFNQKGNEVYVMYMCKTPISTTS